MQGAGKSWTPSGLEQSETRLPPRLMSSNRATKSGFTADRLAAGSFDARLAADGKSGREQHQGAPPRSAHRTTDSKNPPAGKPTGIGCNGKPDYPIVEAALRNRAVRTPS